MPAPGARSLAKKQGLTTYFTGKPCKRGHISLRAVASIACLECRKERAATDFQKWYVKGENKKRVLRNNARWKTANPKTVLFHTRNRQAGLKQRMPVWADRVAIQKIYEGCPPGHHVDHEIPLHGKTVSGLHVESNLQYLPAHENAVKAASWPQL
jgi:hypothetical protein